MSVKMEIEIEKTCRICLKQSAVLEPINLCKIDSLPVLAAMKSLLNISDQSILLKDIVPNKVCRECIEIMTKQLELNKIAKESENYLESILNHFTVGGKLAMSEIFIKNEVEEDESSMPVGDIGSCDEATLDDCNETDVDLTPSEKPQRGKKHQCQVCFKSFEKPSKLKRHAATHDVNRKPFSCSHDGCFQRFITDASLQRHQVIHSLTVEVNTEQEKTHECLVCSKKFTIQEALASHLRTHKAEMEKMEFPCKLCDKKFKKLNELTRHQRTHPENKNHKCLICSKVFSQGSHLIDHLNRHQNLRPHVCHICNKAFQQSSTLKDHIRTHSSETPFLCSECGKSFNNPSNLRQHIKRHLNLKEFACHLCPGKYSCKASLDSHILSHTGVKPFSCSSCGSSFTKGSSLQKHIRTIHEGIRPFKCDRCEMRFNSSEHLKRHYRSHTKEKPYVCNFEGCDKAYAQTNDLLKHKKTHVGELVYKCSMCSEAFRLQSQLRAHYSVHYREQE